ncbi:hypothetical protein MM239_14805 [Belliella sp. DSM 111904]|uniref:Uncharacterized protein n=1 Tax=Belliella filtrata TaxID=2923435 RepID=A0ABS9V2N1_9BACT|nr:hypothetical protein [Belliella filtrata]MCH7410675.1 hypothetical protein [Belliella filtrata]
MPNKAYAILFVTVSKDDGYLYFPIKREGRRYGGMPQFFGGSKDEHESDRDTIAREMLEESDGKLTLQSGGLSLIYKSQVGINTYSFYVAESFSGSHFLGPLQNDEMARIDRFLVQYDAGNDVEDLLYKLNIQGTEEFYESETCKAFEKAISWSEKL